MPSIMNAWAHVGCSRSGNRKVDCPEDNAISVEILGGYAWRMDSPRPCPPPAAGLEQTRHGKIFA